MEQKQLDILVIEDQNKHFWDVEEELNGRIAEGVPLKVDYAANLKEALALIEKEDYDGIISDIFFPEEAPGGSLSDDLGPRGRVVALKAMEKSIPVVFCTSTWHHGEETEPVYQFSIDHQIPFVDRYVDLEGPKEAESKDWKTAYRILVQEIIKKSLNVQMSGPTVKEALRQCDPYVERFNQEIEGCPFLRADEIEPAKESFERLLARRAYKYRDVPE
mgnify:CR=1 FL=1